MTTLQVEMNKLQESKRSNVAQEGLKDRQVKLDEEFNPHKIAQADATAFEKTTKGVKHTVDSAATISKEARGWVTLGLAK